MSILSLTLRGAAAAAVALLAAGAYAEAHRAPDQP
jgi:hypothetical protein